MKGRHMGRGKQNLATALAAQPWPITAVLGVAGFFAIGDGIRIWLVHSAPLFAQALAQGDTLRLFAWGWLLLCLGAAAASYLRQARRRRLLDTRDSLQSLAETGWRNFERLVGEAFRRQGYSVEETGLGGPDGGIDLILRKDGLRTLVQCKQWKRQQVGVAIVREMYGLMAHHQAAAVKIVTTGSFTRDASNFVAGKPIELVSGEQLLRMIQALQPLGAPLRPRVEPTLGPSAAEPSNANTCPRCGAALVERRNRRTGQSFLGCSRFPACRGH